LLLAGAQGGDEQVDVVKRLAVTPTGAHQLDDPARSLSRIDPAGALHRRA